MQNEHFVEAAEDGDLRLRDSSHPGYQPFLKNKKKSKIRNKKCIIV
jgi:hypothetical protein